jgi:iron complex outermembrane receptor protein/vitamin B12 transporter
VAPTVSNLGDALSSKGMYAVISDLTFERQERSARHPNNGAGLPTKGCIVNRQISFAAAAMLLAAAHTSAQQPETPGATTTAPPVEVSAYRVPLLTTEAVQGVSVVTEEQIDARKPANVMDLLQLVPGVQVDQVGAPGGVANVYIRGSDSEQVLVLVDGVRMNDPMLSRGGSYDLSSIDPGSVERIEVLRGGGSAIYGADAMGGVINIVTRRGAGKPVDVTLSGGAGGDGYGTLGVRLAGNTEQVSASVNASHLEDGEVSQGGDLDLDTVAGSLAFHPSERGDVQFFFNSINRDSSTFPDQSGGIELAVIRTLEQREVGQNTVGGNVTLTPWDPVTFKLQLSSYNSNETIQTPGVAPGPANPFGLPAQQSVTDFTRDGFLVSAGLHLPLQSDLVLGYERLEESGRSDSVIDFGGPFPVSFDLDRATNSLFASLKSKPAENVVFLLELRDDDVSDQGSELSPGVGVRFTLPSQTTLKARYSEGFRPPSFFALANPLVGNPDLVSETSKGGEIGLEQTLFENRVFAGVTGFFTEYENLVDFDETIGMFGQLVNRSSVEAQGAEVQVAVRPLPRLSITASYTYLDTSIENTTQRLLHRPRNSATFGISYAWSDAWRFVWNTVYASGSFDFSIPTGEVEVDDWTRTDVALSYTWKAVTATFAVDNLFDSNYEQYVGFVAPGIRARAMVTARF